MNQYFILTSLFLMSFFCKAQDTFRNPNNLREGNRWEGTPEMLVGATMQLTGIHREVPDDYVSGDNLSIHFYQPKSTTTVITACHKDPDANNYLMEVKQRDWNTGWQIFAPWHVSEVLIPSQMKANDLGVLIKTTSGVYLPASIVKNSESFTKLNRYRFYIWPPGNIRLLTYKVLNTKGQVLIEKTKEENQAKIVINLLINMEAFPSDEYKLVLQNGTVVLETYTFYHVKL